MATTDCKERLQLKKILIAKEKTKRHQRKTLTVSNPFELRTQKRVRLDIEEMHQVKDEYEPLWAQIQKSFKLRDSGEADAKCQKDARVLTKPKSPVFHTDKRMKLKDDISIASADKAQAFEFKAMPLNKKIFEQPGFLP